VDTSTIERKVKEIEEVISDASQKFPNSSFIFEIEAKFSDILNQYPQALEALKKAFSLNKRSAYIAVRLASMYEITDKKEAIKVLKECLDANPDNKYVNYKLGMILINDPDSSNAEIIYHLRRAFIDGDGNYAAQFWYDRMVYLFGKPSDAWPIFKRLRDIDIDYRVKNEVRGLVKENNVPIRYSGIVRNLDSTFGFIIRDGFQDVLFAHRAHTNQDVWDTLRGNSRITFELAFTYRGPSAIKIKLEGK
jgi:tetratricopeptide (TPR) repeat protein